MKLLPDSGARLGLGLLVAFSLGSCGRPVLDLDLSVQGDDVVFAVRNGTGDSITVSSGLLDTAKSPNGDFILEVRRPSGQTVPLCAMIDSHEPPSRRSVAHGETVEFREDAELVRAVYCLDSLDDVSFSIAYSKVEAGDWQAKLRTESVRVGNAR